MSNQLTSSEALLQLVENGYLLKMGSGKRKSIGKKFDKNFHNVANC